MGDDGTSTKARQMSSRSAFLSQELVLVAAISSGNYTPLSQFALSLTELA